MSLGEILFAGILLITICVDIAILFALHHPSVVRKAGPDWMWRLASSDPVRNAFFRPDGSLRRYSLPVLTTMLAGVLFTSLFLLYALSWSR